MGIYTLAESAIQKPPATELETLSGALDVGNMPATPSHADTLDNLTKYIPTESITLYVAALGVSAATAEPTSVILQPVYLYWLCAALTPVIFVLLLIRKRATDGLPLRPDKWPIWKIFAATIAFLVWALAVPNSPYLNFSGGPVIAGFGALFVSLFLSLLDPIFDRVGR
jgi:hypothetical protein